ncbi:MAG: imidazole glycerol phosphate synthase cyclase subunit [Candidatus Omnitrophica bacterium]|nr:imidazole glycerol phosphate synthase cyclase subunit [Candidatus Omnitrophota bacterium]
MLKKRLIPVLILRDGQVVQSIQFRHTNVIHWNPVTAVDFFNKWAVDEILLLDVSRTTENRQKFYDAVHTLSAKCFVPLTVGGWVTSTEEIRKLLRLGADKVSVNTQAVRHPEFISEAAQIFGSQCIVVSIDVKKIDGARRVVIDRGREITELAPVEWAREAEKRGAGEIFLTSIDHDGTRSGYDLELMRQVSHAVSIPVIAFGGAFAWEHLAEGILAGAEACAAANVFHFTEHSTKKAKEHLRKAGIEVR